MIGSCTRLTRGFASRDFRKSRRFHFIPQLSKLSIVVRHISFLQESAHAPMHRTRGPHVSTQSSLPRTSHVWNGKCSGLECEYLSRSRPVLRDRAIASISKLFLICL